MCVQIAPLPDGGVSPAARQVSLGLALHLLVVGGELAAFRHVTHNVEQPVAHAPREVQHLVFVTFLLSHDKKNNVKLIFNISNIMSGVVQNQHQCYTIW